MRGEIYVGNVLEMKKWAGRADDIGCTPSSTGLLCKPVLKVQRRPRLRSIFGAKHFSTGWYHEPVLKVPNEPVLQISGALGSGAGTSASFSTGL